MSVRSRGGKIIGFLRDIGLKEEVGDGVRKEGKCRCETSQGQREESKRGFG